jgi:CheY-like chemotaxis protein
MAYVVVVEDDTDSSELVRRLLEREGFEVDCMAGARTAIDAVQERQPDLLIVDLRMPDVDGVSLLEHLRSVFGMQSLPAVVLTGLSDGPLLEKAQQLKLTCILTKGKAMPQDIIDAVNQSLRYRVAS